MKRNHFISGLAAAFTTPTLFISKDFVLQKRATVTSVLRDAFGENQRRLFKRISLVLPKSMDIIEIDTTDSPLMRSCIILAAVSMRHTYLSRCIYHYLVSIFPEEVQERRERMVRELEYLEKEQGN